MSKKNSKKNMTNGAPVPQVDELTQAPAVDEVPVIAIVEAKELDPQAYAEANGEQQTPAVPAESPTTTETPAPAETPAGDAPAGEPAKDRVFHLRLNQEQIDMLAELSTTNWFTNLYDTCNGFVYATASEDADTVTKRLQHGEELVGNISSFRSGDEWTKFFLDITALCERAKKAPGNGNGNGTGHKIFGRYSPIAILNWMGHAGFNQYDAKNALRHFGIDTDEIAKTTWSRALAKGKKPDAASNKVKIITDLTPQEEVELMGFYNLAAREAADAANAKIEAAKAKLAAAAKPADAPAVTQ